MVISGVKIFASHHPRFSHNSASEQRRQEPRPVPRAWSYKAASCPTVVPLSQRLWERGPTFHVFQALLGNSTQPTFENPEVEE